MRLTLICWLLSCLTIHSFAAAQFYGFNYRPQPYYGFGYFNFPTRGDYFRAGASQPSVEHQAVGDELVAEAADARFFFTTLTITVATTTSTSYVTTSTTCTTSTAALKTCSPSGRRKRSLLNRFATGGLFYDETSDGEDLSIYLPIEKDLPLPAPSRAAIETTVEPSVVPYVVQPGFQAPQSAARFLVAFGTSTIFVTSTVTYTGTLTANCSSTSGFGTCGSSGK